MQMPFTRTQFFDVMAAYNLAVWPAQLVLLAAAALAAGLALRHRHDAGRWVAAVLALLWTWMGIAYHWLYFTAINPAAWAFGALSLAGAAVFAGVGVMQGALHMERRPGPRSAFGWALIGFALLVYPVIGKLAGHDYPAMPTFGLPCPTTIFTIGILLLARQDTTRWIYAAPVLWTAVGSSAAFLLGVYEDLGLLVAGAAGLWAMFTASRRATPLSSAG